MKTEKCRAICDIDWTSQCKSPNIYTQHFVLKREGCKAWNFRGHIANKSLKFLNPKRKMSSYANNNAILTTTAVKEKSKEKKMIQRCFFGEEIGKP